MMSIIIFTIIQIVFVMDVGRVVIYMISKTT